MRIERSIEERLQTLEDLEAILELTFRYADSVDRGVYGKKAEIEALDNIFTDDAYWHFDAMGVRAHGREEIKAMLTEPHRVCWRPSTWLRKKAMEKSKTSNRYSPEVRARAVRMVLEHQSSYETQAVNKHSNGTPVNFH